jgi:glycosyltransferase involved in cell wall biosynthesis
MHILFIPSWYPLTPDDINGCFFREQAIVLAKSGHDVGVLSLIEHSQDRLNNFNLLHGLLQSEKDMGVETWRIHHAGGIRGYGRIFLPLILKRFFKKYCRLHGKPDILHAQSALNGGARALLISRAHGIPYVVTEHSSAFPRKLTSNKLLARAKVVFKNADAVLAVSKSLADCIKAECSLTREVAIVPNIVNKELFKNERPQYQQKTGQFQFLNIGLLTQIKGQNILIKAFAKAFADRPAQLLIGGYGEEYQSLKELIDELEMTRTIRLLGRLSRADVYHYMLQCDAFVLSSLFETFGVVLIEALACGKPIVATACGGPEDIVSPINGILVEKNSIDALASGMSNMYHKINSFQPEEIRKACFANFGQKAVAEKLTQIYQNALLSL